MTYSDEAVVQGFRGARPTPYHPAGKLPSMRTRTLTLVPLACTHDAARGGHSAACRATPDSCPSPRARGQRTVRGGQERRPQPFGRINTTPRRKPHWGTADEPCCTWAPRQNPRPAHYRTAPAGVEYAPLSSQDEANSSPKMLLEERIYGNHPYRESAIIVRSSADVRVSAVCSPRTVFPRVPPRRRAGARRARCTSLPRCAQFVYARKRGEKALNPRRAHAGRSYRGGGARRLRSPQRNRS